MHGGAWRLEVDVELGHRITNVGDDAHDVAIRTRGLILDGHEPGVRRHIAFVARGESVPVVLRAVESARTGHLLITWRQNGDELADVIAVELEL